MQVMRLLPDVLRYKCATQPLLKPAAKPVQ